MNKPRFFYPTAEFALGATKGLCCVRFSIGGPTPLKPDVGDLVQIGNRVVRVSPEYSIAIEEEVKDGLAAKVLRFGFETVKEDLLPPPPGYTKEEWEAFWAKEERMRAQIEALKIDDFTKNSLMMGQIQGILGELAERQRPKPQCQAIAQSAPTTPYEMTTRRILALNAVLETIGRFPQCYDVGGRVRAIADKIVELSK